MLPPLLQNNLSNQIFYANILSPYLTAPYDNYGYYTWDKPWLVSNYIGLTSGSSELFTRVDMALLSYKALGICVNGHNRTCFSVNNQWGRVVQSEQYLEAFDEFGESQSTLLLLQDAVGSDSSAIATKIGCTVDTTVEVVVHERIGNDTIILSSDASVLEIPAIDKDDYTEDNGWYIVSLSIIGLESGRAAIIARSGNHSLQVIHVDIINAK